MSRRDEFYQRLHREIGLDPREGSPKQVKHPKTGFNVDVGRARRAVPGSSPPMERVLEHGHFPGAGGPPRGFGMGPKEVEQRPLKHVYRAVSEDEYSFIERQGYMQTQGKGNICQDEGTCAMAHSSPHVYLPSTGVGRILKIKVHPDDGWKVDERDGYVKSNKPIPKDRIVRATTPIKRENTRIVD